VVVEEGSGVWDQDAELELGSGMYMEGGFRSQDQDAELELSDPRVATRGISRGRNARHFPELVAPARTMESVFK
jgi:hypothetical protein